MGWTASWIGLGVGAALFAFGLYRSNRPADPFRPRLLPWTMIALFALVWCLVVITHMLNLLGVDTSQPIRQGL